MSVNELIEHLKTLGDEKWRDMAQVVVVQNTEYVDSEYPIDEFDVKCGIKTANIII